MPAIWCYPRANLLQLMRFNNLAHFLINKEMRLSHRVPTPIILHIPHPSMNQILCKLYVAYTRTLLIEPYSCPVEREQK